jgi:hypothetical protein
MRPLSWQELRWICEQEGCRYDRERGDHYIMVRPGLFRPVVFPKKKALSENIVLSVARTIGLEKKKLREYLDRPMRKVAGE